jgi:YggT family protein
MNPFLWLISTLIQLYIWILIANAVLSWLVAFNVVNPSNNVVRTIGETLYRLTEPALRPIRQILPSLGGLDISPVILIILLIFVQRFSSGCSSEWARRDGPGRIFPAHCRYGCARRRKVGAMPSMELPNLAMNAS